MIKAIVGVEDENTRLDVFLAGCPGIVSRSSAQALIESGRAVVNAMERPKNHHLKIGDEVAYSLPEEKAPTVEAQPIPIKIVYEDDEVIVVDKQAGLVVHPAVGNYSGTLVNALLAHTGLANIGAPLRPGIVHRLDKETSGLMVAAKTDHAYMSLVKQLKDRRVTRTYLTLVEGVFSENEGRIDAPIGRNPKDRKLMAVTPKGGREAVTGFIVLSTAGGYSLLRVRLETGRTHQIRVHMKFIKHPVIGDPVYGSHSGGRQLGLTRQWLHAAELEFDHPSTGERVAFKAGLPADLKESLAKVTGVSLDSVTNM